MAIITPNSPLKITVHPQDSQSSAQAIAAADANPTDSKSFWSSDGPSFKDVLDTINPLQHIPIISNIYQALTGDTQSTGSKLAGSALFGGPIGFFASVFDSVIQSGTGASIGSNVIAAVKGDTVPAMHTNVPNNFADGTPTFQSPNQRASYNAYVRTSQLTA